VRFVGTTTARIDELQRQLERSQARCRELEREAEKPSERIAALTALELDPDEFDFLIHAAKALAAKSSPAIASDREGYAMIQEWVDRLWECVKDGLRMQSISAAVLVAVHAIRFASEADKRDDGEYECSVGEPVSRGPMYIDEEGGNDGN
jgi:hypothetical protein